MLGSASAEFSHRANKSVCQAKQFLGCNIHGEADGAAESVSRTDLAARSRAAQYQRSNGVGQFPPCRR